MSAEPHREPAPPAEPPPQSPAGVAAASAASPVMAQYHEIKRAHPGCLLFFRMGDFYELFFEDAVAAAPALDIALTKRGRHDGADIPMCGVPVHTADAYLARLIRAGFKVAICEQLEDPAEARRRGNRGPVRRGVIRVVTAGTLTEEGLLDARRHNYLAGIAEAGGELGLAWLDLSTGAFSLMPTSDIALGADLARIMPGEILLPERLLARPALFEVLGDWKPALSPLANPRFDSETGRRRLESFYGVKALDGFGGFSRAEIAAAGALVDYVALTQQVAQNGALPLSPPQRVVPGSVMQIDAATRRNLELVTTLSGERRGSLLATIDRTLTGAGARLLADHLAGPLTEPAAIMARLDAVQFLLDRADTRSALRERLRRCPDIQRALTRLSLGRGGPRDLAALRDALGETAGIRAVLSVPGLVPLPELLAGADKGLGEHGALVDRLGRALAAELPLFTRDGGFIAPAYAPELDQWRELRDESRRTIAALQARYAEATGVASLRIRHNNVIGYYLEVSAANAGKLGPDFIHRQTMAGAVRYTTVELGELESKIASAAERALALELRLFEDLVGEVMARRSEIAAAAASLAALDVAAAHAEGATEGNWVRPEIDDDIGFEIRGGRHPTVEAALAGKGAFIANDCVLGADRIWLVTGPNMAGKSTFLRQNALIAIMAQIGAFVPARSARIGIVDRLFSRVGAADDLARGRSTFMVEMVETAAILNQAGPRSFVILDEIGRGTATFDGLSIAWAALEHLHEVNRCRALFATHYHELTALAGKLPALACHTMRVKEWQGDVVFLHEVAPGTADRSYGIHVAKLAGLPASVTARAEEVLEILEKGEQGGALARLADDLPLFRAARRAAPERALPASPVEELLREIRPDELTPREALEWVYRLKAALGG